MVAGPGGSVTPETGPQPRDSAVVITAIPEEEHEFAGWTGEGAGSYDGTNNPAVVVMVEPITQTATFTYMPQLEMIAGEGGTVSPSTGRYVAGSIVNISAIPDGHHVFREWKGEGDGSYTGTERFATVSMNGPITQVAEFERKAYEVTLSLSDTDPHVHTGDPVGFGSVYLWFDCGTSGGIHGLVADVWGTLEPLAFHPAPYIVSAGTPRHLALGATDCLTGPVLLGEIVVAPPGEGSMCLGTGASTPQMRVSGCPNPWGLNHEWPQDLKITGVRTDGGVPCETGRGCDEPLLLPEMVVSAPAVPPQPVPITYEDSFEGTFPNPFEVSTKIRFSLSQPQQVRLSIYDVTGRRVRLLLDEERPAGAYDLPWSGRDADGRAVPAGIYFVELDAGPLHETAKLVKLGSR